MKQPGDFFGTVQNFLKERPILLPDGASIFTPLSIEQSQLQACASWFQFDCIIMSSFEKQYTGNSKTKDEERQGTGRVWIT